MQPTLNPTYTFSKSNLMLRTSIVPLLFAVASSVPARGQGPVATLYIELQNVVEYQVDVSDLSKWGTNSNITPGSIAQGKGVGCVGVPLIGYGDIVSVNGQPAKGTYANQGMAVCMSPTPTPGSFVIADATWLSKRDETFEILQSDGTPVGTIMTSGLASGGPTPPGPRVGNHNYAIVGGTGAFLGARGQKGNASSRLNSTIPERTASVTEDPARRRQNGGGHLLLLLNVIPMSRPDIVITANGAAVTHAGDFSLVTASKPAAAGEILSLFATGLGPARTILDVGQPFPLSPLAVVNSPIEVTVNGESAEVLSAVGYPGTTDAYQVNFRVPLGAGTGSMTLQISSAWIPGAPITIPMK